MSQLSRFKPKPEPKTQVLLGPGPEPASRIGHAQLARLFRIILILQTKQFPNANELGRRCEVSRRTIYRDIDVLGDAGVIVQFRHDRQGYEITKGFFLPPLNLEPSEAISLLILAQQKALGDGLGLAELAWSGSLKLLESLPAEVRERSLVAAEPFLGEVSVSEPCTERVLIHEAIVNSLMQQKQLRLWYLERATLVEECTKFAPYRAVLNGELWFLVGRSSLHRRIEVIGVPWIRRALLTDEPYALPIRFNLDRFFGMAWGVERSPIRFPVWLRFRPGVAIEVAEYANRRGLKITNLDDGGLDLHFCVDGIDELFRWVMGFGDQVEVLAPPELRDRILKVAENLARVNRTAPQCQHPPTVID